MLFRSSWGLRANACYRRADFLVYYKYIKEKGRDTMARIYKSIEEMIGGTPLLQLGNYGKKHGLGANLLAKVEAMNPGGSAKDRVAKRRVEDAERAGILREGATIIEPTSGNTGIGLAVMAAARGYRAIIVMPDTMSMERRLLMTAFGAELVLTEGQKGMAGAIERAEELAKEIPDSFIPGQFDNPSNPAAHYDSTGPEIYEDTDGKVDIFVAGIGTGGTITGVGRYLKEKNPAVKIVGVEPASSPLLTKGTAGPHGLQGIGANFVPSILDRSVIDEIMTVTDEEAYETGRELARAEGLLAGISAGAAAFAAAELAKRPENAGKNIVVLLPDTGDRYLSTEMFRK